MSDNHEDPTGTHKPQRKSALAIYEQWATAKLMAAVGRLMGDAGPPVPAQLAENIRRNKRSARNVFRWARSSRQTPEGGGARECARRMRQIERGQLQPSAR